MSEEEEDDLDEIDRVEARLDPLELDPLELDPLELEPLELELELELDPLLLVELAGDGGG